MAVGSSTVARTILDTVGAVLSSIHPGSDSGNGVVLVHQQILDFRFDSWVCQGIKQTQKEKQTSFSHEDEVCFKKRGKHENPINYSQFCDYSVLRT